MFQMHSSLLYRDRWPAVSAKFAVSRMKLLHQHFMLLFVMLCSVKPIFSFGQLSIAVLWSVISQQSPYP